ncbi:MAG: hypothetical protein A3I72_14010 [Candidatus Tectomicrobia bacterium RIFCSPLOWO2_02_FULL_70_19]|nr:MAG: hypothetical protein A3I72_14010 [Candidatus Tectomicrobia bacterium RIFCSPLOWO2_02_FULL_70_19]
MVGAPPGPMAPPGGSASPRAFAWRTAPKAISLVAKSRRRGFPSSPGRAMARGFVPSRRSAPPRAWTRGWVTPATRPTQPARAMRSA